MPAPPRVFISYRRDDSIVHATLLRDRLAERFGGANVFLDKEDIAPGEDFERAIDARIAGYDVLLAVIGPRWGDLLDARPAGAPDYVRREIAGALERRIRVIPVLVGGATPAQFAGVPSDLAPLRTLNALAVKDAELREDITALVESIQGRRFREIADDLDRGERRRRRARYAGLGVGLAAFFAAWVALGDLLALDTRVAALTLALGAIGARPTPADEVMLVTIDAATEQRIGRKFDRSWRREHAVAVDRLAQAGARTIVFDLFFSEPDADLDAALAAAITRARESGVAVVVAVDAFDGGRPRLAPGLTAAVSGFGIACAGEKLGIARSMPLATRRGEATIPSLALAAFAAGGKVEAFDERDAEVRVDAAATGRLTDVGFSTVERARAAHPGCPVIERGDTVALQLLAPAPAGFWLEPGRRLAYEEVVDGAGAATRVKGRHVLVGLALAGRDVLRAGAGGERFGVELHAEQLDAIVRGEVIRPLAPPAQVAVMIALGLAGAYARRATTALTAAKRWAVLGGVLLAYLALAVLVLRIERILLNILYEIAAFALAYWLMGRIERRAAQ